MKDCASCAAPTALAKLTWGGPAAKKAGGGLCSPCLLGAADTAAAAENAEIARVLTRLVARFETHVGTIRTYETARAA